MKYLIVLCLILSVLLIGLAIRYRLLKKSLKEIQQSLPLILHEESNQLLYMELRDNDLSGLILTLNHELTKLRRMQIQYSNTQKSFHEEVSNFFHDLKTPLTAAIGYMDLALSQENPQIKDEYLSKVKQKLNIIKNQNSLLLDSSVILFNQDKPKFESVNLKEVLERVLLSFYEIVEPKEIELEVKLCEENIWRNLSPDYLTRILENLISNAIRYGKGKLEIILDKNGVITVRNPVSDFSQIDLQRIFDRYYSVQRPTPSTGLGLSIAKTLTERMNGTLNAHLENSILSFILEFPLVRSEVHTD